MVNILLNEWFFFSLKLLQLNSYDDDDDDDEWDEMIEK